MLLLDMPPEMIERILENLIRDHGFEKVQDYRRVSKTFDKSVEDVICNMLSRYRFSEILKAGPLQKVFNIYGSRILQKQVMQSAPGTNPIFDLINRAVSRMVETTAQNEEQTWAIKQEHTLQICRMLIASRDGKVTRTDSLGACLTGTKIPLDMPDDSNIHEVIPVFAAAINDHHMMSEHLTTLESTLERRYMVLPSALESAAIVGDVIMISTLLGHVHGFIAKKNLASSCNDMRRIMSLAGKACCTAMRLQNQSAGSEILEFMNSYYALDPSQALYPADDLVKYCIWYGHLELLNKTCLYIGGARMTRYLQINNRPVPYFPDSALQYLIDHGSTDMFRALIWYGQIDTTRYVVNMSVLAYALEVKRWDLAGILIEYGADVNATVRLWNQGPTTLLTVAFQQKNKDNVNFLLEHGAITDCWNHMGWGEEYCAKFAACEGCLFLKRALNAHNGVPAVPGDRKRPLVANTQVPSAAKKKKTRHSFKRR